ncbi:hypothetical protein D3C76_1060840 [compost metagenome]
MDLNGHLIRSAGYDAFFVCLEGRGRSCKEVASLQCIQKFIPMAGGLQTDRYSVLVLEFRLYDGVEIDFSAKPIQNEEVVCPSIHLRASVVLCGSY